MAQTEEKLVKIVDTTMHSRGASVIQEGDYGALVVKDVSGGSSSAENASLVLEYDNDGNVSTITKTVNGIVTVKTLTYTDGVLTNVSAWEEV